MSVAYKFKVTLWDNTGTSKWRGAQTAVVFDAKNIGVEEFANDPGSAYWTLSNDHPQLSKHIPLSTHYEISRWSDDRSRWEFVGAGLLNDYQSSEYETIFSGIDYKSVLNQIYSPLINMDTSNTGVLNSRLSFGDANAEGNSYYENEFTNNKPVGYTSMAPSTSITFSNVSAYASAAINYSIISNYRNVSTSSIVSSGSAAGIVLSFDLSWTGATTGFDFTSYPNNANWAALIVATPPGERNQSIYLPMNNFGQLGAPILNASNASSGVNRFKSSFNIVLFSEELYYGNSIVQSMLTSSNNNISIPASMASNPNISYPTGIDIVDNKWVNAPLKSGISYTFQIFGLVYRPGLSSISITQSAATTAELLCGSSENETTSTIITRIFNNAKSNLSNSRIAFSSLTTIGSNTKTYDSFSAGEPTLNYIAGLCDIEMGSKTDSSRVLFGIDKPTGSAEYNGNFKLNLSVSSAATTAISLKYPENIKAFAFNPGYSKVKNDITVIPYGKYYTGNTGLNPEGISIIGSNASDSASINSYGRIPFIVTKSGYIDTTTASSEAARLLSAYSVTNTRSVSLRVTLGSIDIWNNWDLGESINVKIRRGLVDIDEPFVISGVRWFGEGDGSERIELELVQGSKFNSTRV